MDEERIKVILKDVVREFVDATMKYGSFRSRHEGYAVLKEEVDELWDTIKWNEPEGDVRIEAIQVAAMALRFLYDICKEG